MTSSLTAPHALVGEEKPSQPAHQQPRYFTSTPASAPVVGVEELSVIEVPVVTTAAEAETIVDE